MSARHFRRTRRGFTLLEVLVALGVTAIVVGLAYATLTGAIDVQARTGAVRDAATRATATRALLHDALRHAVDGATGPVSNGAANGATNGAADAAAWQAETDASGRTTRLSFVTRGIVPPLGASGRWRVTLDAGSPGATAPLLLTAQSLDDALPPLRTTVPGARAVRLALRGAGDATWRERWTDATRLPEAIEVQFLDAAALPLGPPVVARRAPVGAL